MALIRENGESTTLDDTGRDGAKLTTDQKVRGSNPFGRASSPHKPGVSPPLPDIFGQKTVKITGKRVPNALPLSAAPTRSELGIHRPEGDRGKRGSLTPVTSTTRSTAPTRDFKPAQIEFLVNVVRLCWREDVETDAGSELLLKEHFTDGMYVDAAGLCKVTRRAEIEAQGWSLNPGRYTGSAAIDFHNVYRDAGAAGDESSCNSSSLKAKSSLSSADQEHVGPAATKPALGQAPGLVDSIISRRRSWINARLVN